jgi:hypothetical protein
MGLRIRPADLAINYRYIQPNHINSQRLIVFDIDQPLTAESFNLVDAAPPNFIVQDRMSGRAHIAYALDTPIHLNHGSSKAAIKYAADIQSAYLINLSAIGADSAYGGLIMKNPLHSDWSVYQMRAESYDLTELAEYVDIKAAKRVIAENRKSPINTYGLKRNESLFETVRFFAYDEKKNHLAHKTFFDAVMLNASDVNNQFPAPLPISEVLSTAKSIAKWSWRYDYYTLRNGKRKCKKGRDRLKGAHLTDLKDKQVLSAAMTNRQRKDSTELKIKTAIEQLIADGEKLTKVAVAKKSGISRKEITNNYKHLFPIQPAKNHNEKG